jgi:hypothetical protein
VEAILERLLERLSTIVKELPSDERRMFTVVELRQTFGTLTVYLSEAPTPAMWAAIGEASEASMVTCEVCGAPGTLAERHGWTSVRVRHTRKLVTVRSDKRVVRSAVP